MKDQNSLFEIDGVQHKQSAFVGSMVDRRKVTAEEARRAEAVLVIYNEVSEQNRSTREWLAKIVMRVREHPDLTVEEHRGIIERNFSAPWWKGRPSPSVIYGNAAVFESAMHATGKKELRTHAERKSDRLRRLAGQ